MQNNSKGDHASPQARLAELEARITFQEDQIEELQKALYLQSQELDRMTQKMDHWISALRQGSGEGSAGEDSPPPHY